MIEFLFYLGNENNLDRENMKHVQHIAGCILEGKLMDFSHRGR